MPEKPAFKKKNPHYKIRPLFYCYVSCIISVTLFSSSEENKSNNDNIYIHIPQLEKTFPVLYRKTQTVEELKTQIHHKEGVKKSDQYLSFRTSALKDDDTLGSYSK